MVTCVRCHEEIVACREDDDCVIGWMHAESRSHLCPTGVAHPAGGGEPCPRCGDPLQANVRTRRGVYYVDSTCPACGFTDADEEGGV